MPSGSVDVASIVDAVPEAASKNPVLQEIFLSAVKRQQDQLIDSERRLTLMITDLKRSRQALEAQAQQFGQNATAGQFANQAAAQEYAQNQGAASFANAAQAQANSQKTRLLPPARAIRGADQPPIRAWTTGVEHRA